jgi:hypothetical protein
VFALMMSSAKRAWIWILIGLGVRLHRSDATDSMNELQVFMERAAVCGGRFHYSHGSSEIVIIYFLRVYF